jgi:hypothetical protein
MEPTNTDLTQPMPPSRANVLRDILNRLMDSDDQSILRRNSGVSLEDLKDIGRTMGITVANKAKERLLSDIKAHQRDVVSFRRREEAKEEEEEAPTQYLNNLCGFDLLSNSFALFLQASSELEQSIFNSGILLIASITASKFLYTIGSDIPWVLKVSAALPPANIIKAAPKREASDIG